MNQQRACEILELDANISYTPLEVRRQYRHRAKDTHPDRTGGDGEEFRLVSDAMKFLIPSSGAVADASDAYGGLHMPDFQKTSLEHFVKQCRQVSKSRRLELFSMLSDEFCFCLIKFLITGKLPLARVRQSDACEASSLAPLGEVREKKKQLGRLQVICRYDTRDLESRVDSFFAFMLKLQKDGVQDSDKQIQDRLREWQQKEFKSWPVSISFKTVRHVSENKKTYGYWAPQVRDLTLALDFRGVMDGLPVQDLEKHTSKNGILTKILQENTRSVDHKQLLAEILVFQKAAIWPNPMQPTRLKEKQPPPLTRALMDVAHGRTQSPIAMLQVHGQTQQDSIRNGLSIIIKSMQNENLLPTWRAQELQSRFGGPIRLKEALEALAEKLEIEDQIQASEIADSCNQGEDVVDRSNAAPLSPFLPRDPYRSTGRHQRYTGSDGVFCARNMLEVVDFDRVQLDIPFKFKDVRICGLADSKVHWLEARENASRMVPVCVVSLREKKQLENAVTLESMCRTNVSIVDLFVVVAIDPSPGDHLLHSYLAKWPSFIYMIIPESNLGIGYKRYIVKNIFTCLSFKMMWMLDDNIRFSAASADAHRQPPKDQNQSVDMWRPRAAIAVAALEPLLWFQNYYGTQALQEFAVAGFSQAVRGNNCERPVLQNARFGKAVWINLLKTKDVDFFAGAAYAEDRFFFWEIGYRLLDDPLKIMYPYRYDWNRKSKPAIDMDVLGPILPWRQRQIQENPNCIGYWQRKSLCLLFADRISDHINFLIQSGEDALVYVTAAVRHVIEDSFITPELRMSIYHFLSDKCAAAPYDVRQKLLQLEDSVSHRMHTSQPSPHVSIYKNRVDRAPDLAIEGYDEFEHLFYSQDKNDSENNSPAVFDRLDVPSTSSSSSAVCNLHNRSQKRETVSAGSCHLQITCGTEFTANHHTNRLFNGAVDADPATEGVDIDEKQDRCKVLQGTGLDGKELLASAHATSAGRIVQAQQQEDDMTRPIPEDLASSNVLASHAAEFSPASNGLLREPSVTEIILNKLDDKLQHNSSVSSPSIADTCQVTLQVFELSAATRTSEHSISVLAHSLHTQTNFVEAAKDIHFEAAGLLDLRSSSSTDLPNPSLEECGPASSCAVVKKRRFLQEFDAPKSKRARWKFKPGRCDCIDLD